MTSFSVIFLQTDPITSWPTRVAPCPYENAHLYPPIRAIHTITDHTITTHDTSTPRDVIRFLSHHNLSHTIYAFNEQFVSNSLIAHIVRHDLPHAPIPTITCLMHLCHATSAFAHIKKYPSIANVVHTIDTAWHPTLRQSLQRSFGMTHPIIDVFAIATCIHKRVA